MRVSRGLTLIELLAALVIVAMLMTATLCVVTNLCRAEAVSERSSRRAALVDRLHRLLAHDIVHADQYRLTTDGFALRSRAALDSETMQLRHRRCMVGYEVSRIGTRNWLLRSQRSSDGMVFKELVCSGVRAVGLEPGVGLSEKWKALPTTFVVTVAFKGEDSEPEEFRFHKSWSP